MDETKALTVQQNLTPGIWEMLSGIGTALCDAQKFSIHTPAEGAIKALFCLENGLPLTAARGLYVVNGKLGIESSVIAALIRRHPDYDYTIPVLTDTKCIVAIHRGDKEIGRAEFNQQDAERAELWKKQNWQAYPQDMLFAKAITRAQRRYAPDIFMAAVYSTEEMQDWNVVDVEPVHVPTHEELMERYGLAACQDAGAYTAHTADALLEVEQKLKEGLDT